MGFEYLDQSFDATGLVGDGTSSFPANEEGFLGSGWDGITGPTFAPLPPGGGPTAGGGPIGVKSTPLPRFGEDPDPSPPPPSTDPEVQAQALSQLT
jgi:hypothetical protein